MPVTFREHSQSRHIWLSLLIVAAVYLITLSLVEKDGVWVADNGNKLIQVQGILRSGYRDYSMDLSGSEVDPGLLYAPVRPPFGIIKEYKLYSIFSPVFALVSTLPYAAFGYPGLYIIPCLSTFIMLLGLLRILTVLEAAPRSRVYAVLITALCTPIWFYSVEFWEHSAAVCLGIWSVFFCLKFVRGGLLRDVVRAAVLAALAAYFRDEFYVFCVLLAAVMVRYARNRRCRTGLVFGITLILSLLPLWIFQWRALGAPFGFHLETHIMSSEGILRHLRERPRVFYNLFAAASERIWLSMLLTAPYFLLFISRRRLSGNAFKNAVPVLSAVALLSSFFVFRCYFHSETRVRCMALTNSLFPTAPILILALVRREDKAASEGTGRMRQMLHTIALGYALLYGLTAPLMGSWGIHWGNRLLLLLYPLLAALSAINLDAWRKAAGSLLNWRTLPVAALILVSLGAQIYSIDMLERKKRFNHEINLQAAGRPGRPIITDSWWVGQELHTQFYERMVFRVRSADEYQRLMGDLAAAGHDIVLFVTPSASILTDRAPIAEVADYGLNFWYLRFLEVRTGDMEAHGW